MPRARSGSIEIEYEVHGPRAGVPLLLIAGIGAQLTHWHPDFVASLGARGYRVIIFDHRDCGRSTHLEETGAPPLWPSIARGLLGLPVPAVYRLADMAGDAAAVLDHLGIARAHLFGVSMGGMIAQELALADPARVLSLTSVMSTPGGRRYATFAARIVRAFLHPRPRSADEAVASAQRFARAHGTPYYQLDDTWVEEMARRSWERGSDPAGYARQLLAIIASGSRRHRLRSLRVPTLVVHGTHDPVIPARAGRATARHIPGSRLLIIPNLGHEMPRAVWPQILDAVAALIAGDAGTVLPTYIDARV